MKALNTLTQLSLATILLTGLAVPQALAQDPGTAREHATLHEEINRDFDEAARNLARTLSDPAFRMWLWREIQASRDKEKILDLRELLTTATDHAALAVPPQALLAQSQAIGATEEKMRAAQFPEELVGVNLYFPVESHRQQWQGDEELLVAFDPVQDESEMRSIIAYSVKTGEVLLLDLNEVPSIPTLVIAAKERPTVQPSIPAESPPQSPQQDNLEAHLGGYIWIRCLTIYDTHEPWIKGDPEVYVLAGQSYMTTPLEHRIWLNSGPNDVNKKGKRYCFGDTSSNPLYFYFDENYSDLTYFRFMESDSGSDYEIDATVEYKGIKVGLSWDVKDGDDTLGSRYVNKNQVSCRQGQRDLIVSTGDVKFEARVLIMSDPCPPPIIL